MKSDNDIVRVKNLTDSPVVYLIPEDHLRRVYREYEEKQISVGELRKVFYQPGGPVLLRDFLQIKDREVAIELGVDPEIFEHEYSWDKDKVDSVLLNENIDILHDALDFAPEGIIDLIVDRAIELQIPDINKRDLISKYTGKDITRMITIKNQVEAETNNDNNSTGTRRRRVQEDKKEDVAADSLFTNTKRRAE